MSSPLRPEQELVLAAFELSNAVPELWRKFMAATELLSAIETGRLVQAPPEQLAMAQGRARAVADLVGKLRDCRTTAPNIIAGKLTEKNR